MVTTNNPEIAHKVRMLRDHGSEKRYYHELLGWNARLDELQAAALRIKLPHLDEWNDQRRRNAEWYQKHLESEDIILPWKAPYNRHVYHLYVIRTPNRDALREHLNELGIGTGIHYPVPNHLQNSFVEVTCPAGSLPVTEALSQEILSLPMYPELTEEQIMRVSQAINRYAVEPAPA